MFIICTCTFVVIILTLVGCFVDTSLRDEPWAKRLIGDWIVSKMVYLEVLDKAGWGVDGFLLSPRSEAWLPPKKALRIDCGKIVTVMDVRSVISEPGRKFVLIGKVDINGSVYSFASEIMKNSSPEDIKWATKVK